MEDLTFDPVPEIDTPIGYQRISKALMILNKLPKRQSDLMILFYLRGMTYVQIGNHVGISEETVKTTLRNARLNIYNLVHPENKKALPMNSRTRKKLKR